MSEGNTFSTPTWLKALASRTMLASYGVDASDMSDECVIEVAHAVARELHSDDDTEATK